MLKLPNVTLVIAESRAHALAARAINDVVSRVKFGDVIIYSDDCWQIDVPGATYRPVKDWGDKIAQGSFYYKRAAYEIRTSHALLMEWDAGISDVSAWTDEFLKYDCIGAPWYGSDRRLQAGLDVGNGGFMLMSRRLGEHLAGSSATIATDVNLCCDQRQHIERFGFKWAPTKLAEQFSFENWNWGDGKGWLGAPKDGQKSFGYHGVFNWQWALTPDEFKRRVAMLTENEFTNHTKLPTLNRWLPQPPRTRQESSIDRARQARARQRMHLNRLHTSTGLKA